MFKSNKKILQLQLPGKAQPHQQLQLQLEQQRPEQQQIESAVSQNLANSSLNALMCEASERRAQQTAAHSTDATAFHSSSSDASTASCDSDSEEAVSEKLASMCHHCLRPQIELQLRHLRPQQRRQWSRLLHQQRSKRRSSKSRKGVSWSVGGRFGSGNDNAAKGGGGGPVGAGSGGYAATDYNPTTNDYTTGVHWARRDVSAAVRYRCPQVGPKPAPYHFHHPQQLHNAYQLQLLLQQCEYVPPTYYQQQQQQQQQEQQEQLYYRRQMATHNSYVNYNTNTTTGNTATTLTIECDSQAPSQKQQQQLPYQQQRNQNLQLNQNLHTMTTATTTIKTATLSGCSEFDCTSNPSLAGGTVLTAVAPENRVALQQQAMPLGHNSTRGTVSDSELQLQQLPAASESPSLVKKFKHYFPASCSEDKNNANDSPW